uniref:Uncharacterized protein n=1 Tax=Rhizophora mucronata TaxID=61149 RepID=A0A2P2NBB4_RHIMU
MTHQASPFACFLVICTNV